MNKREIDINERIASILLIGIILFLLFAITAGFAYTYVFKQTSSASEIVTLKAETRLDADFVYSSEELNKYTVETLLPEK